MGENLPSSVLSTSVIKIIHDLNYFVVEKSKSARKFLKLTDHPLSQSELLVYQIDKHNPSSEIDTHIKKIISGVDVGFISESGMPGIADPGSYLAAKAHQAGIIVRSLTGPNSITLALAGSGLNGQSFCFHGYLPKDQDQRRIRIGDLELNSRKLNQTQIFIETPYRNQIMMKDILKVCGPETLLCISSNLTLNDEFHVTLPIKEWKNRVPDLNKKPTVFLLYAGNKEYLN